MPAKLRITVSQAYKLQKTYGDAALDKIRENPYCMAEDIEGIGFKQPDAIALNGIQPTPRFVSPQGLRARCTAQ